MKTFTHSGKQKVRLSWPELARGTHKDEYIKYKGEEYDIIDVTDCSGKFANSYQRCQNGGDPHCPGNILLDREPFNKEPHCWCWGNKSMFEFLD